MHDRNVPQSLANNIPSDSLSVKCKNFWESNEDSMRKYVENTANFVGNKHSCIITFRVSIQRFCISIHIATSFVYFSQEYSETSMFTWHLLGIF